MLFQPILALDIMNFFKFAKLLAGGGQNDMFAPQYFHWGGGGGGGGDCPTVGSFFIFRLENVQSGAYL